MGFLAGRFFGFGIQPSCQIHFRLSAPRGFQIIPATRQPPCGLINVSSYNKFPFPREAFMPFLIRLFRRFPVQCVVPTRLAPFRGTGTVWNLSRSGWRLSGAIRN